MELYDHRETIGANMLWYMQLRGYSKLTFSHLTGISRPTMNKIFTGTSPNPKIYYQQIQLITEILGLPVDYFLHPPQSKIHNKKRQRLFSDKGAY